MASDDLKSANDSKNCWPAFFKSNNDIKQYYTNNYLWQFIPIKWRCWWTIAFQSTIDNTVTLNYPKSFFVDRTSNIEELNAMIQSFSLPNLPDICNKLLIPNVICPYGCSCFIHRHGIVSLDLIIQRYLQKCIVKKLYSNRKGFEYLVSTRDNFLRNEYEQWLFNNDWMVQPSITFIKKIPYVMTCDDHNKGTKSLFIHPSLSPPQYRTLSSKYSDQLTHCAIRTRSLKPMQRKYYSTCYQMNEQRDSFNGIDICNITTYRKRDINSKLLSDFESISIINRADINSLLNQLVKERRLSKVIVDSKRSYAQSQ